MDIVDAQIHIGPGRIDEVEASMDALGISAVLSDPAWPRKIRNGDLAGIRPFSRSVLATRD